MHILLTRPLEDSHEMILRFQSLGHKVSHIPLINIESKNYESINFSDYNGIIFTSANAIKFINSKLIDKKISCFCVGSSTEKKAKSVGFQNIFCADGNVNNLKELILQNFNSSDGKLLYVSGEIISNELDQQLIVKGYNVKRIINYTAKPMSFLNLIKNYQLDNLWMSTNLMCISEKISNVLNEIKWKKIFLFNPGEEEFLLYKI